MKSFYRIEMMTEENYGEMMRGNYGYHVEKIDILAESKEEAIATAKKTFPEMVINEGYVRTLEEIEAEKKLAEERWAEEKAKKEAQKAKRLANEIAKAEAEGLTVEEYRAKKNHERKVKAAEKEVAEAEKALAEAKKRLEELRKRG